MTTESKQSHHRRNMAHARRRSRERALQAIYQWDLNQEPTSVIVGQFLHEQDMSKVDLEYFELLVTGTIKQMAASDDYIRKYTAIPLEQLDPVERSILRLSLYELIHRLDVPYRVVINEGVELTKRYGGEAGHKFVNGILDKVAKVIRPLEMR